MGQVVGIDLGTTNSVIASAAGAQPSVLVDRNNKSEFRSVVSLKKRKRKKGAESGEDAGDILVGDVALDNWPMAPEDTIVSIKRLMGRAVADPEVEKVRGSYDYEIVEPSDGTKDSVRVVMGGKQYSPVDVSAMILKKAKEDAEFRLGEEVTHAVVTVPAYFSQRQKGATRKAGLQAGLQVIRVLEEPTAAAIAFGMDNMESDEPKCILVYDLGGGTFDISILMWAGNVFAPLNLEGDMWLGGDNFDQVLVQHAVAYVKEEFEMDPTKDKRFVVELKKAAKATKERLSSSRSADLIVASTLRDEDGDFIDVEMEVTQDEYNRMIQPLVDRATALVEKALKNADLTPEGIDAVLMAGNSTCIPLVQESMEQIFGTAKLVRNVHPKQCVALGAALVAERTGRKVICQHPDPADPKRECGHVNKPDAEACAKCGGDLGLTAGGDVVEVDVGPIDRPLTAHSYGVQTAGDKYTVFIEKNEAYPTEDPKTQTFYTREPNQRMICIPVYGGDDMEKASLNEKQGEAFAVLPPGLPSAAPVRIRIWLDSDGIFDLAAYLEDGTNLDPVILEGEKNDRVVKEIEEMEAAFEEEALKPEKKASLEKVRNEAFDKLRNKDVDGAREQAAKLREELEQVQEEGVDALSEKAEKLTGFVQFVLLEYSWAMPADQVYKLNKLVESTRDAVQRNDLAQLEKSIQELDAATNTLPPVVMGLLNLRGAIQGRILPVDPGAAEKLMQELESIEQALKGGDASAAGRLNALATKVMEAIDKQGPSGRKCPACGAITGGIRYCPKCQEDTWALDAQSNAGSGTVVSSGRKSSEFDVVI